MLKMEWKIEPKKWSTAADAYTYTSLSLSLSLSLYIYIYVFGAHYIIDINVL